MRDMFQVRLKMDRSEWIWLFNIVLVICMTFMFVSFVAWKINFDNLQHDICVRGMVYDRMFDYMEKVHGGGVNETEQGIQIPESSF